MKKSWKVPNCVFGQTVWRLEEVANTWTQGHWLKTVKIRVTTSVIVRCSAGASALSSPPIKSKLWASGPLWLQSFLWRRLFPQQREPSEDVSDGYWATDGQSCFCINKSYWMASIGLFIPSVLLMPAVRQRNSLLKKHHRLRYQTNIKTKKNYPHPIF